MAQCNHGGGFSVDASVGIETADHAGRERLLPYCARPPFILVRLHELDPECLLDEGTKSGPDGNGALLMPPLELLDRIAALVPPPCIHRHRYFGARRGWPLPGKLAGEAEGLLLAELSLIVDGRSSTQAV